MLKGIDNNEIKTGLEDFLEKEDKDIDCLCEIKRKRDINNFIEEYVLALNNNTAAVFAGAGLSIPSGEMSWKNLLRENADRIGLNIDKEDDLISVAQYIYNESGTRNTITRLLKNHVDKRGRVNENHEILARLPIQNYWTTNYDTYIERALEGKKVDIKRNVPDLASDLEGAEAVVYKMHGDITAPDSTVLIKDDYEIYDKRNELFISKLRGDLLERTFIFIGFSFDDPNLENILGKLRVLLEGNPRRHYCFLKRVNINDPEIQSIEEKDRSDECRYRQNKQVLKIHDLLRYGIKIILVDEYSEITEILKRIEHKYLARNVFISGAIAKYDMDSNFNNYEKVDRFCQILSAKLYKNNFKISTCMGLGIGRSIITGVLNEIYDEGKNKLEDQLIIRPFPVNPSEELKNNYRKEILQKCGSIIFLFGNKMQESEIVLSDGMQAEYEIAKELGMKIIPIGVTGLKAEKLWNIETKAGNELIKNLNKYESDDDLAEEVVKCSLVEN